MAPLNKIVILITGDPVDTVREAAGDYGDIIRAAVGDAWTGAYATVDARHDPLPAMDPGNALIISGSSANVHVREPWITATEGWLRDAVNKGTPALGLCFGHQLLAQALGGEVAPNPRGREIGTALVNRILDDRLFEGVDETFTANQCHSDTVTRLPPQTTVLARSPADEHQCLRFSDTCYGVQFHPEFDGAVIREYIDARSEAMRAEGLDPAVARAGARDTPVARRVLGNFVRMLRS